MSVETIASVERISVTQLAQELARDPFDTRLSNDPDDIGRLLLETALVEGTTERSLLHAHVPGLHSIMLFDREQTGAGKIRLFY
ncbi:MAG TPA: hypothetical protein VK983_03240, partial [Candidatus Limnocylindrales bacterium]|nr:hypothetical protein [Candidatus Limnocylindrales bacterium]